MMLSHRSTRIPSVLLGLLALAAAGAATGVEDAGPMTGRNLDSYDYKLLKEDEPRRRPPVGTCHNADTRTLSQNAA